jgi:hypothetical protein
MGDSIHPLLLKPSLAALEEELRFSLDPRPDFEVDLA